MRSYSDTSAEIEEVRLRLLREQSPAERLMTAVRLCEEVRKASKRAIARTYPELSPSEQAHLFIGIHYGKELADAVQACQRESHDG